MSISNTSPFYRDGKQMKSYHIPVSLDEDLQSFAESLRISLPECELIDENGVTHRVFTVEVGSPANHDLERLAYRHLSPLEQERLLE